MSNKILDNHSYNIEIKIKQEYEKLVPPLPDKDYQELKESIKKDGLFFSITVNEKGEILDGHHRFRASQEFSINPKLKSRNLIIL